MFSLLSINSVVTMIMSVWCC